MSNTPTPSEEDKLFITEDLEDRLDLASLQEPLQVEHLDEDPPDDFYASVAPTSLPPPPKATVAVIFGLGESLVLDGSLQSLSFGPEGWLCTISVDDAKQVTPIAVRASKEAVASVQVSLEDGSFVMQANVDCTASFSYGSASFTVTSDEARYV